jgi:hypothetical protein
MGLHPRRLGSSSTLLWELQISYCFLTCLQNKYGHMQHSFVSHFIQEILQQSAASNFSATFCIFVTCVMRQHCCFIVIEVKKLLKDSYPSSIVWHCANHRLGLSAYNTVIPVSRINRLEVFIGMLYVLSRITRKLQRNASVNKHTRG